jgi:hypothetical protein
LAVGQAPAKRRDCDAPQGLEDTVRQFGLPPARSLLNVMAMQKVNQGRLALAAWPKQKYARVEAVNPLGSSTHCPTSSIA